MGRIVDKAMDVGVSQRLSVYLGSGIDDAGLDPYEFRVYLHLKRRAQDGLVWEGQQSIADVCKMSRPTVHRALTSLEEKKWIEQENRTYNGRKTTNLILILEPPCKAALQHDVNELYNRLSTSFTAKGTPLEGAPNQGNKTLAEHPSAPQPQLFEPDREMERADDAKFFHTPALEGEVVEIRNMTGFSETLTLDLYPALASPENTPAEPVPSTAAVPAKTMTPEAERRQHFAIEKSQRESYIKTLKEILGEKYIVADLLIKKHGMKPQKLLDKLNSTPAALAAIQSLMEYELLALLKAAVTHASKHTQGYQSNVGWQFFDWLTKRPVQQAPERPQRPRPEPIDYRDPDWQEKFNKRQEEYNRWYAEQRRPKDE